MMLCRLHDIAAIVQLHSFMPNMLGLCVGSRVRIVKTDVILFYAICFECDGKKVPTAHAHSYFLPFLLPLVSRGFLRFFLSLVSVLTSLSCVDVCQHLLYSGNGERLTHARKRRSAVVPGSKEEVSRGKA